MQKNCCKISIPGISFPLNFYFATVLIFIVLLQLQLSLLHPQCSPSFPL